MRLLIFLVTIQFFLKGAQNTSFDVSDVEILARTGARSEHLQAGAYGSFLAMSSLLKLIETKSSLASKSWRIVMERTNQLGFSNCSRDLYETVKTLGKIMDLTNFCKLTRLQNRTIIWECNPKYQMEKLEKLLWAFTLLDSW